MQPNPLEKYFRQNKDGNLIFKWLHYFEIYHRHFEPYRGKKVTIVEFGVASGGSLDMWRDYFGGKAKLYGIDIDPECKRYETKDTKIFIGDQADRKFLRKIRKEIGPIDILIEDGGHAMNQQIATFEEMYPAIKDGGVFLIEDLHTSYWKEYGGGYKRKGTFIEYTKNLIDQLNAWHSKERKLKVDDYTKTIKGIHVYDSVVVFDKGTVVKPKAERVGAVTLQS